MEQQYITGAEKARIREAIVHDYHGRVKTTFLSITGAVCSSETTRRNHERYFSDTSLEGSHGAAAILLRESMVLKPMDRQEVLEVTREGFKVVGEMIERVMHDLRRIEPRVVTLPLWIDGKVHPQFVPVECELTVESNIGLSKTLRITPIGDIKILRVGNRNHLVRVNDEVKDRLAVDEAIALLSETSTISGDPKVTSLHVFSGSMTISYQDATTRRITVSGSKIVAGAVLPFNERRKGGSLMDVIKNSISKRRFDRSIKTNESNLLNPKFVFDILAKFGVKDSAQRWLTSEARFK
ncbi:MAG: hypothetical protein PHS44_05750 [Candidatus Dojkabacteria bacterium]|nr:hypothetical protein [Candidatus Dojkabacteria bacterium]